MRFGQKVFKLIDANRPQKYSTEYVVEYSYQDPESGRWIDCNVWYLAENKNKHRLVVNKFYNDIKNSKMKYKFKKVVCTKPDVVVS